MKRLIRLLTVLMVLALSLVMASSIIAQKSTKEKPPVIPPSALPDLKVNKVWIGKKDPGTNRVIPLGRDAFMGEDLYVTCEVTNTGADLKGGTIWKIGFYRDGNLFFIQQEKDIPSGATLYPWVGFQVPQTEGIHKIGCALDYEKVIPELREDNNSMEVQYNVVRRPSVDQKEAPGPKEGKVPKQPPALAKCNVQDIKVINKTYYSAKFQVSYYIDPSYPEETYLTAYIPTGANRNTFLRPTPVSAPKGSNNIELEVQYGSTQLITTPTIEVVIYDKNQQKLCSSVINSSLNWGAPVLNCRIDTFATGEVTSPHVLSFYVAYYIDPSYPNPTFVGARVPTIANANPSIIFQGSAAPKGSYTLSSTFAHFDIWNNSSQPVTFSTIEVMIYDYREGTNIIGNYCSKIFPFQYGFPPKP